MQYRKLGRTGYMTAEIGFSAWSLTLIADDAAAQALVRFAVKQGVTLIDTSPLDGAGRCESLAGRAIEDLRGNVIVATRGGLVERNGRRERDFAPAAIDRAARESRERLQCEYIHLYQLHHPTPDDLASPELWAALAELRAGGVIKHVGAVCNSAEAALAAAEDPRIETLQLVFNVLDAEGLPALRRAYALGKGVLAGAPLLGGLLAGGAAAGRDLPGGEQRKELAQQVARLHRLWPDDDRPPAQAALGWVLAHSEVSVALLGARTEAQLAEALAASDLPLPSNRRMAALQHLRLTSGPPQPVNPLA